jgi:pSer/pThr/pTyr-binding forkhead associated (FHA) protein
MQLRLISPQGETAERAVTTTVVRLGRDPACEVAFDPALYPTVSGEHARIERTASGLVLTPRSRSNQTLLNDRPVEGPVPVQVGDRVRLGFTGPTVEILGVEAPRPKTAPPQNRPARPNRPRRPRRPRGTAPPSRRNRSTAPCSGPAWPWSASRSGPAG